MKKLFYILMSICFFFSIAMPLIALAQTNTAGNLPYTPLEPIAGLTSNPDLTNPSSLPIIINAIFKILITVGALLAVLMLTVGGIQYMISGSAGEKNVGIKRAQAALWGIVLLAAAYLILYTINPTLLNFTLTPCASGINCIVTAPTTPSATPAAATSCPNGTICAADDNAAITTMQNTPTADMTQQIAQAAQSDLSQEQQQCADKNGVIGPGEVDGGGCAIDSTSHMRGNNTYTNCANIQIPNAGYEACYYNAQ